MAINWDRLTPQQRQRRVARLVKKPGTRSKIPTRYLPREYRRQREMNERLAQPVVEGSRMTNREAARERNATVDLRYGPLDHQLQQQLQQSQRVQQAIPQWYDQYRQLASAAQAGSQQGYQAATQQFQQMQAATGQPQGQAEIAAMNQQAQALGGVADPQAAQVAAQAAQVRAGMAGSLGGVVAAQGAGQNAYAHNLLANTGRHQIESLLSELQQDRDIRDDQAQLGREKGAYRTQVDRQIRDREQRSVLERAAFNLDVANTRADNERADRQLRQQQRDSRRREQREAGQVNQYGYTDREWRRMSTAERQAVIRESRASGRGGSGSGSGSGGGRQPAPRQEPRSSLTQRTAIVDRTEFVKKYMADHNIPNTREGRIQMVNRLRRTHRGMFANPAQEKALSAALDLAMMGRIGSENLKYWRNRGVFITSTGGYWGGGNRGAR